MAAVWCIVSVPWPITTPSAPPLMASPMAWAVPIHCSAAMFSLNTPYSFSVCRLQMSTNSGTAP